MTLNTTEPTRRRSFGESDFVHRLLVVHGPRAALAGSSVPVGAAGVTLGREAGGPSRLVLDDSQVSRTHAVVEPHEGGHRIRDAGSRNGTYLNGARVSEAALSDEDVLRVGGHVLLFQRLSVQECEELIGAPASESSLIGTSLRSERLRRQIRKAAVLDAPILILGESGVGKELVAAEAHRLSGRSGSYVTVNCAALPEQLAESELFGHVKGAFTGAAAPSQGLFGEADGGTIFLDEIGEMPLPLQAKLLRTLATGEVRAVGETRPRTVRTRVVAATNVDLEAAVEEGTFRGDLYARLMGAVIEVPPLRERRQDILPLAKHFLGSADKSLELSSDSVEALLCDRWRFNVRELEQICRLAAAESGGRLELQHLPPRFGEIFVGRETEEPEHSGAIPIALRVPRDRMPSAAQLQEVAEYFGGNVSQVAGYFQKSRRQIYRWAEQLGVSFARQD